MNIGKIIGFAGRKIFGSKGGQKAVEQAAKTVTKPLHQTKTLTDAITGKVVGLEREFTSDGKDLIARVDYLADGSRKLTVKGKENVPFNPIWRTTNITREKGASVFGGDKITVDKHTTKYWQYGESSKLTKEYSPNGVLQHKELQFGHSSGNGLNDYTRTATQDLVYDEHRLTNSAADMLKSPHETEGVMHSLNNQNNYYKFADKKTNYQKDVEAKKQAAIDAAKKAEAEKIAAQEAAEKAAAELKAKRPRINTGKVLGRNIEELTVKETKLADGTIERTFYDPATGKKLITTRDNGLLHQEWITGSDKAEVIYMKKVGKDEPYIYAKKGDYTQIVQPKEVDYYGRKYTELFHTQYYTDHNGTYLKRGVGKRPGYADGKIKVHDPNAAEDRKRFPSLAKAGELPDDPQIWIWHGEAAHGAYDRGLSANQERANYALRELNKDADKSYIDLEDLYSDYKA